MRPLLLLCALLFCLSPARAAPLQAFAGLRPDPPPAELVRHSHYVVSNEDRHYLFHDAIAGLGGVFIGVGTDQNYVMAAWARPEVLVLMDFDQVVVDLHRVYRAFFLHAATPADFIHLWDDAAEPAGRALLRAAYPDPAQERAAERAYHMSRDAVRRRLDRQLGIDKEGGVPSFLSDPAQYAFLAGMFREGRVFMVRGDLVAQGALHDIGEAARQANLPVRVLYLSNAERYFKYNDAFKANVRALPMDERALVLRTSAHYSGAYDYVIQSGQAFQAWLKRPGIDSVQQLLRLRDHEHAPSYINVTPDTLATRRAP